MTMNDHDDQCRVCVGRAMTCVSGILYECVCFCLIIVHLLSNKEVGLENKQAESMRDGKTYQFFQSKPTEPASFGAFLVLSTIVLTRN